MINNLINKTMQNNDQKQLQSMQSVCTEKHSAIILAKYTPKIKDLEVKGNAHQKITECINYWLTVLGVPPNNRPDALGYAVIQNFFVEKMNYVSPEQLILAIDLANQKKFECDLTLYNRTFSVGFITPIVINYLAYEKTIKDTKIVAGHKQLAVKTKPTNEEIAAMNDKFFKESFETFCKTGWFDDIGNALHTLLVQSNKIGVLTYEKYMSEAKVLLEGKYDKGNAKTYQERNEFKRVLEQIENNSAPQLEIMAKKICLNEFFKARKETIQKSLQC